MQNLFLWFLLTFLIGILLFFTASILSRENVNNLSFDTLLILIGFSSILSTLAFQSINKKNNS